MTRPSIKISRQQFIRNSFLAVGSAFATRAVSLGNVSQKSAVVLSHSHARYIDVTHRSWNLSWKMQLPEVIICKSGIIQYWQALTPDWKRTESGGYRYVWESNEAYAQSQLDKYHSDSANPPNYIVGVNVAAGIEPTVDGFKTQIAITNNSQEVLEGLYCEGGCFQARGNAPFTGNDSTEASLRYAMINGKFVSMDQLHRTKQVRCRYYSTDESAERNSHFDFWGNSNVRIDEPAVIGARSKDGKKVVVFAYEGSNSIWQNSDDSHHCLHSSMELGNLEPGKTVTRKGHFIFGDDLEACRKSLLKRIS